MKKLMLVTTWMVNNELVNDNQEYVFDVHDEDRVICRA